jgi:PTH1 family peptidyl-tRNA hydrolase
VRLFVGLGNPGIKYRFNRHNIGFLALGEIARRHKATPWRSRFQGETAETTMGGVKALLLKPETYMNDSGRAVEAACHFYKIAPADVVVFHDELDLPPAKLRVKLGGGNAGHNGLRSISACIGNDYWRVRLGIGHPGDRAFVHAYVLSDFPKAEQPWVEDLCRACADYSEHLATGGTAQFANKVDLEMKRRGWDEDDG